MCLKKSKPPGPDPSQIALAESQARLAETQREIAKEELAFAREQNAWLQPLMQRTLTQQADLADENARYARDDRARYQAIFAPVEDQLARDAVRFSGAAEQERLATSAVADVATAFDANRQAAIDEMLSMGVNPNSGRFADMGRTAALDQARATAGAATNARLQGREMARARLADVAALGRGLPGQSVAATQMAIQGGLGSSGQAQGAMRQNMNSAGNWFTGAGNSYAQAGSMWNDITRARQTAHSMKGPGLAGVVGGLAGTFVGGMAGPMGAKLGGAIGSKMFGG